MNAKYFARTKLHSYFFQQVKTTLLNKSYPQTCFTFLGAAKNKSLLLSLHFVSDSTTLALMKGFDLTSCDLYFMILAEVFMEHILTENTYFTNHIERTEHKIMVLKPANKYQIIWQYHNLKNMLIGNCQHHPFLYRAKVL